MRVIQRLSTRQRDTTAIYVEVSPHLLALVIHYITVKEVQQMKIQRVELNRKYYANIHCPFCGALVYEQDKDDGDLDSMLKPCSHTLFFAYDDDLHFRSARFDELKSIDGKSSDDISDDDAFES